MDKKKIPKKIRPQVIEAFSYFPELENTQIEIKFTKNIKTSMSTRPAIWTLFKNKNSWKFYVFISKNNKAGSPLLEEAEFSAQVGCIAHEFSHIMDYLGMTRLGLVKFGILYAISTTFRQKVEKENDIRTIKRGVGIPLYKFAKYVYANSSEAYRSYKFDNYFTPDEILEYTLKWEKNSIKP